MHPVKLATGQSGQFVQDDDMRGHHVFGQLPRQVAASASFQPLPPSGLARRPIAPPSPSSHLARYKRRVAGSRHFPNNDCNIGQSGKLTYACLDFTQLNPKPPNLHLMVSPADIFDIAVIQPTHQITRTIESPAISVKWIGYKALRCQSRSSKVPASKAIAADVQFPNLPTGTGCISTSSTYAVRSPTGLPIGA